MALLRHPSIVESGWGNSRPFPRKIAGERYVIAHRSPHMEHVDYRYIGGMSEERVDQYLRNHGHGVLALADDNDSYAVPLDYYYDGSRLFLRVSTKPDSEKVAFAETTETATFVVYDVDEDTTWSILVRGAVRRLSEAEQQEFTDTVINETFSPFRLFDEDVEEVTMTIYELDPERITGRQSVESS
ncbi:pyridoxamine 5'-phosphate oxidase family protein [Halorussus salilacus]|uniref:pyridoxamine 5'-phosphate oxidase family protein n=1 Tax=Halorussus salilacus TaxID=2953750 RepID=UPI00209DE3AD|nr:pyridoxamine 5'-phosphate oxidase family protein [Halorussus salilacus]USZ67219.1 pyridoxamine 5'-phosphate oxidase family protein [Halorussus salilacus]